MNSPPATKDSTYYPSGSADIDAARLRVSQSPTEAGNCRRRALLLYLWLGALQQQGANARPFTSVDRRYHPLEARIDEADAAERERLLPGFCALIDEGYGVMESIQRQFVDHGPIATPFPGDPATLPAGGDMTAEWTMFQRDKHNKGYTEAPGPRHGRATWKFPVGLGWYSRPVVEDGRVYLASPGMNAICYCLSLESGAEIWKATQEHGLLGIYKYPAIASTPIILAERIVLRDVNSHWGNESQAKYLVYLDKSSGAKLAQKVAGHIDYRTQYAPLATNGSHMVYPYGVHDIYRASAICQNFNRLICADIDNDTKHWDFNVGDIDALAEPMVTSDLAIVGTMEGYLYALWLNAASNRELIAWQFRAAGAVNTQVALAQGRVYFGCNGGSVYCLVERSGELIWRRNLGPLETRARKHVTTPLIHGDRICIGAANKRVYALHAASGDIIWTAEASDWVRARPAIHADSLYVATIDGKLHCYNAAGKLAWSKTISAHPIYAVLTLAGERLLLNDSDLSAYCLTLEGDVLWRKSLLDAFVDERGQRVYTDELSGGTYYQSKPTAYRGKIYFGTPARFLHAVEANTGAELWKFEMGAAISVGPACADGRVFAGQQGGERFFYCLDADDGKLIWKQTLPGGWVWGSAAVDDGLVYVPTVSGYAVCLDAASGHIVWMFPTARSIPAEPAIDGDLVYFGSWSGTVYAFDKKTGDVEWKTSGTMLDSGTLIAHDGKVYLPNHRDIFNCLDAKCGAMLMDGNKNDADKGDFWNFNATPAIHGQRGYFTSRGSTGLFGVPLFSTVYCVDTQTGAIIWTYPDGGGLSAPALVNGRVYVASGTSPFFYCLDAETGQPHWIYRLGRRVEEAALCIYRDKVFALAADGYVHALE